MNKKELVSVVMSIYDRYDFLQEALSSIINQTYDNIEIIIVIDPNKNIQEEKELIKKISSEIKIITNAERLGFAKSLNIGINEAKGKYIARMDDDDISFKDRIEKEVDFLEKNPNVDVVGSYIKCFGSNELLCTQPLNHNELKVKVLFETPLFHPTVMFRKKSFVKNNLFYDSDYLTEDYELWSRAIDKVIFANIDEVLLNYRVSAFQITTSKLDKIKDSHVRVMRKQFKEKLNIDLSAEEIIIIRKIVNSWLLNFSEILKVNKIIKKIINANKNIHYCDEKILKRYLSYYKNFIKKVYERLIK